jgi:transcriptional regulator with GAF, ATPase, and Fis domain
LINNLQENNQRYLFNPGKAAQQDQEKHVLEYSIENLKKAADFINQISEGNYQVDWQELNEENRSLNKDNLVGKLIGMREQMKKVKQEDEKRLWTTEGINQFSENIRKHQHSLQDLCYQSVVFLVKYLRAQQGGLFIHQAEEGGDAYLELAACYAFDRKKFVEKRIEIGHGILGQTYLEAETVLLTELPQKYTTITSGLGEATPTCLLVVPMKYNDKVQAILEIAGFHIYEPHEIAFIEKAGEFIASAIAAAQSTEMTQTLLAQFQEQAEQMRAQEEEMRQNMEELVATQEEMHRKEQEYLAMINKEMVEDREN